jgi:large subunit ribosomal protein L24
MLCVACSKPTDIEWRFTEKGERVRVSARTGRIIPLPNGAKELEDFVNPLTYSGTRDETWFCLL